MTHLGKAILFLASTLITIGNTTPVSAQQNSILEQSNDLLGNQKTKEQGFLPKEKAFDFSYRQEGDLVYLNWDMPQGYYLYQKEIKVTPKSATPYTLVFPEAELHQDEFYGEVLIYRDSLTLPVTISKNFTENNIQVSYQGCAEKGLCYTPQAQTLVIDLQSIDKAKRTNTAFKEATNIQNKANDELSDSPLLDNNQKSTPQESYISDAGEMTPDQIKGGTSSENSANQPPSSMRQGPFSDIYNNPLLTTLFIFLIMGFILAFTPCVFPMYPIIASAIVDQKNLSMRRALWLSFIYVQGMAITYSALGIVVALAGMQYQAYFQHPAVIIALSALFILFALSMLGIFNFQMPGSWQARIHQLSGRQKGGSVIGVFTMGVLSGLVASPCTTAPLSGALLYIAQSGDIIKGGLALYALSFGMGIPLIVFATSGGKLLPKAGAWMNLIKQIFGLLLLSVVVILLERIVSEMTTAVLWLSFILFSATLLQEQVRKLTTGLKATVLPALIMGASIMFAFPHMNTLVDGFAGKTSSKEHTVDFKIVDDLSDIQAHLDGNLKKPVILDLYADWCVACKQFEQETFSDPEVKKWLSQFTLLQIDISDNSPSDIEVMEAYEILGLPAILIFDRKGQELETMRISGFKNPQDFLSLLKYLKASDLISLKE